jgi:peptidoglycan/LPS O-acetylase OafA/YrhL
LAAVQNRGRFSPLLNSPPLVWLGDISYSLYLLHWFVLFVTTEIARRLPGLDFANLALIPSLFLITVLIAVSLAFATLSFHFIEVTGRHWLRQRLEAGRPLASPV